MKRRKERKEGRVGRSGKGWKEGGKSGDKERKKELLDPLSTSLGFFDKVLLHRIH